MARRGLGSCARLGGLTLLLCMAVGCETPLMQRDVGGDGRGLGGGNLALDRPATASSVEATGLEAAKAVDGSASTRWGSAEGVDPQWIYVDLGASFSISKVKLSWEAA